MKAGEDWSLWLRSEGLFHEPRNGREDQVDPDNQRIRRPHHAQTQQRHPNHDVARDRIERCRVDGNAGKMGKLRDARAAMVIANAHTRRCGPAVTASLDETAHSAEDLNPRRGDRERRQKRRGWAPNSRRGQRADNTTRNAAVPAERAKQLR
jgi:hypothetical protein